MDWLSGLAIRKFREEIFRKLGGNSKPPPAKPPAPKTKSGGDPAAYAEFVRQEMAWRRQRDSRVRRQIGV